MYQDHPEYLEAKKERIANGEEEENEIEDTRYKKDYERRDKYRDRRAEYPRDRDNKYNRPR